MKVLELIGNLSALPKVRSVLSGSEGAALGHGEVCPGGQNLLDPSDAQAGGFLQLAPSRQTWH